MRSKPSYWGGLCLISLMLLSLLVACTTAPTEEPESPVGVLTFPVEMTDQAGRVVRVEKMPEKIISLAPSNTEIVYALGLEDRLVGVTEYCDYPEAAKEKPLIGGFSTVDIEKVVAIQPDLILATNIHKDEVLPQLERLGLTVLTLDPKTVDEILEAINLIGWFTGKKEEASHLVTEMDNRIKAVTDKTLALSEAQRPAIFYILWHDPLKTVSAETRIHELIVKAGGMNIAQDLEGDYPTMSLEAVLMANPQVIIACSGHGTGENLPFQFALTEPRLAEVDARRNDRVYEIDADLTSRPAPRIVDGLEKLAEFIHPELFGESP
jgi:iron complex transport system substrate-binding protein